MSFEKAYEYLKERNLENRIQRFDVSTATVSLAAAALGCDEDMIAKSLSFSCKDEVFIIVMSGLSRVDNHKYKECFHSKAHMLPFEETEKATGHAAGGVCPFGVKLGVKIFLDESLRKHEIVYPAAGTSDSAVRLTPEELSTALPRAIWIDVAKNQ